MSTHNQSQITIGPQTYNCTQREMVVDIANRIYEATGHSARGKDLMYFFKSQHPQEKAVLAAAEDIFEIFWGDMPDYDDEDDE